MAKYKWPGEKGPGNHSISWAQHQKNVAAKNAPTKPKSAPAPAPAAPTNVEGFLNGVDLQSWNDFMTNYQTSIEDLDNQLASLKTDTVFQKTQNDKGAKENTNESNDVMAARGLFSSSVKDAAVYDIEATRALSNKFLDDKMAEATLNAGTRKLTLADSKKRFDEAMTLRKGENAAGVNDPANAAWADKMATWQATQPKPAKPRPAKPARPGSTRSGPQPNMNQGSGSTSAQTAYQRSQAAARRRQAAAARRAGAR
jgi:hypothetical protein